MPKLDLPRKPLYCKVQKDIDFFSLFLRISRDCKHCFLLESRERANPHARYDVIGFDPSILIASCSEGLLWKKGGGPSQILETKAPYQCISEWMPQNIISRNYAGGLVGYLSYDAARFFEPVLQLQEHRLFPSLELGLYTDGLVYDKMTGEVMYFYYQKKRLSMIEDWLRAAPEAPQSLKARKIGTDKTQKEHSEMVLSALEEIKAGNSFQCQIGFQENYTLHGDPLAFYSVLRQINPSPHMFYMKFAKRLLIGASPELVFRLRDKEIESFPLAGTTKRGKNKEEDIALARALLNDPKEIAEHNMLVDLHRNDLGRVARFASVHVRHLMDTKRFSHVQHISSEISGLLDNKHDMFSGLAAVFPAGTLSGAPKIESMKIIERIEASARGPYGGAMGHFGFNGDCTFAIPIRTLFVHGQEAYARASGGIVYDSKPENEYIEIQRKLAAISHSLEAFL